MGEDNGLIPIVIVIVIVIECHLVPPIFSQKWHPVFGYSGYNIDCLPGQGGSREGSL